MGVLAPSFDADPFSSDPQSSFRRAYFKETLLISIRLVASTPELSLSCGEMQLVLDSLQDALGQPLIVGVPQLTCLSLLLQAIQNMWVQNILESIP